MKPITKLSIVALIMNLSFAIYAQKIEVSTFSVYKTEIQALLHWIIDSGSTCNGVSIFHSIDNSVFNEIGHIPGVCGSVSSSKSYNFTDEAPNIYGVNYYKLRFGALQFSEVQELNFNYVDGKTIKINPNPTNGLLNIEFNNEKNQTFLLKIIDSSGKVVYKDNSVNTSQLTVNIESLAVGNYTVQLDDNKGKIVSKQFIILK